MIDNKMSPAVVAMLHCALSGDETGRIIVNTILTRKLQFCIDMPHWVKSVFAKTKV